MGSIVLCADKASQQHPAVIGLDGEVLSAQPWLTVLSSADAVREYVRGKADVDEVWVASSDDMDPINLAAAVKRDEEGRPVLLVAAKKTGSLQSRAARAGLDGVLDSAEFVQRYARAKREPCVVTAPEIPVPAALGGDGPGAGADVAPPDRPAAHAGFVLSVVGGSGGVGKSSVAALSAIFSQGLGYKTVLVDADGQFGDMRELLGADKAVPLDHVAEDEGSIDSLASDGPLPAVVSAPRRIEHAERAAERLPGIIDRLSGRFEVVVVNTGSFWTEQHISLLERSSRALFLMDQRPSSLRACRRALELCARCGIAAHPFVVAVNRCAKGAVYSAFDASCALGGLPAIELREGGPEVEEALSAGQPFDIVDARNALCVSIEHALVDMLPGCREKPTLSARPSPVLRRGLFGRLRRDKAAACL